MKTNETTLKLYFERMMAIIYKERRKMYEGVTGVPEKDKNLCKEQITAYFNAGFPAIKWEWSSIPNKLIDVLEIV